MANLSANVGYLGGKSYRNRSGSGKWIASMLPVIGGMRHEHKGTASPMVSPRKKERIEVLWTNFDPADSKKNRLF